MADVAVDTAAIVVLVLRLDNSASSSINCHMLRGTSFNLTLLVTALALNVATLAARQLRHTWKLNGGASHSTKTQARLQSSSGTLLRSRWVLVVHLDAVGVTAPLVQIWNVYCSYGATSC
jgi:hypothetical protein